MVTTVGTESSIKDLVTNLLYLEHDAIAAYDSTIQKLENSEYKRQISAFRDDHTQHVATLTTMARELGIEAPREGDAKQMLTTGKIALASIVGDSAILQAMRSNEEDTVTAYERASGHPDAIPESKAFFQKALNDERRHRDWMDQASRAG